MPVPPDMRSLVRRLFFEGQPQLYGVFVLRMEGGAWKIVRTG